ncbi:hypothetical protein BLNAU_10272 [Blattamonas nauphoetae]|uniref:Uncharacterized protein n=1 Tax=Blattamonas nauphoetae TaxID=2049346 RepID=A0ABQ9XTH3_9EUKA|nr:hypothetical protein BLNAU_10272 [Blattamonas nauphoetae]
MQTVRYRHQPHTHLVEGVLSSGIVERLCTRIESESSEVDLLPTLLVLDRLCCGLSEVIETEKSKSTDKENSNEADLFSLTRRCGFALARIEEAVLIVEKRVGGQRNADKKTLEVQEKIGGMIVRHFRSSIQSSEKEIGTIVIDLAAVRREMDEQMKHMETERERLRQERETVKESARKAEEERQREFARKMREMEEMKKMNEELIEEGRQRREEKKREEERKREAERKRKEEEERKRNVKGAAAIEVFTQDNFTISGNVFTKSVQRWSALISISFGPVIARITFVIRKWGHSGFLLGLIANDMVEQVAQKTDYFSNLQRAASWHTYPRYKCAYHRGTQLHKDTACKAGADGQRVVMEADGREGKRTLKLSQDGQTQPVFFTNIPVPFRFVVQLWDTGSSVEIVSTEVLREPSMVGGTIAVPMD